MKSVRFTRPWAQYNRGEVAGFSDEEARRLIRERIAEMASTAATAPEEGQTVEDRPDNAEPGEQMSGETADGDTLADAVEAGGYTIKHAGGPWFQVVGPDGDPVGDKAKKADAEAEAERLNAEA